MNWFVLALILIIPNVLIFFMDKQSTRRKKRERIESWELELNRLTFKYKFNKVEREMLSQCIKELDEDSYTTLLYKIIMDKTLRKTYKRDE